MVLHSRSENHRKGEDSELWNSLSSGDPLFAGDSLRTGEDGTIRIQFGNSGKIIDVEPDSLLVLKMNEGKVNLSVLDGNLFVKNEGKIGEAGADETEIVIAGKDGKLLESSAVEAALARAPIQVRFPTTEDELSLNPDNPEPVVFRWTNRQPGARIEVRAGPKRREMTTVAKLAPGTESARVPVQPGFLYWQIVTKEADGKDAFATPIVRHEVRSRFAPSPVFPADKGLVRLKRPGDAVELKWFKPAEYSAVAVEVFADAGLRKSVYSETFDKADSHRMGALAPGTYWWRLKGLLKEGQPPVTGTVVSFVVDERRNLRIPIEWDAETETVQKYVDQPILNLSWKAGPAGLARSYRVRVAAEGESLDAAVPQIVSDAHWSAKVAKPGRYVASVEALDDEAEKIGSAGPRRFEVRPQPLLPRIRLDSGGDDVLRTDGDGTIRIAWGRVDGARSYRLSLSTKDGRIVQQEELIDAEREIKELLPGTYELTVVAVDEYGRAGEAGTPYTVVVPESAALESPRIRRVEVE